MGTGLSCFLSFLTVSSGNGEIAIEMADNCNASCLGDVRETWPPEGFAEPEERVRCSLRCPSNDPTKSGCFQDCLEELNVTCEIPQESTAIECSRGINGRYQAPSRNGTNIEQPLKELMIEETEGHQFYYDIFIPDSENENEIVYYYLVLKHISTNRTAWREITSQSVTINLSGMVCEDLEVSYAVDFDLMAAPLTSSSTEITVRASSPSDFQMSFEEDLSHFQHAILNIWWPSSNTTGVCYYVVSLEVLPGGRDQTCPMQKPFSAIIDNLQSSLVIAASSDGKDATPLYDCTYNLTVQAFPGGSPSTATSDIQYNGPRAEVDFSCQADYNPYTQDYTIIGNWSLSNPLAVDVVPSYNLDLYLYLTATSPRQHTSSVRVRETHELGIVYEGLELLKNPSSFYSIVLRVTGIASNNPNFYRRSLLPNKKTFFTCNVTASYVKPTAIRSISILNPYFINMDTLGFTVKWLPPIFGNGQLQSFEIRVLSEEKLNESSILMQLILDPDRVSVNVSIDGLTSQEDMTDHGTIFVQMRAMNEFSLVSDWSEVASLNLTTVETSTNPTTTDQDGLPVYGAVLISLVLIIVGGISIALAVMCVVVHYRRHIINKSGGDIIILPRSNSTKHWPVILKPLQSTFSLDIWEVLPEDIIIYEDIVLGKGYFGEVCKGQLSGRSQRRGSLRGIRSPRFSLTCTVAIKRLQKSANSFEKSSFLKEIELMKKVSGSDNDLSKFVVNMIGCVTTKEPMLLILEFMKYGNLLHYMRAIRARKSNSNKPRYPTPYLEQAGTYSELFHSEVRYDNIETLQERNLLEFSRQIAAGMEYLSGLDIIHRDLACRNILVGENRNLKISDFGLSRSLSPDETYVHTSHGVLPLRWMSVESLFHREFTSASDVWSYGVVLWEICTLGGHPYPNYTNRNISGLLRQGYRMRRPVNCSTDVYDIMLHCWSENPEDRPKFGQLRKVFDRFLSIHIQDHYPYIEIQVNQPYQFDRLAPETGQRNQSVCSEGQDGVPVDLSDVEEDEMKQQRFKLSPAPRKTRSKISILSSSTYCLEDEDEEKMAVPTETMKTTSATEGIYDTLIPATCTTTEANDSINQTTATANPPANFQPQTSFHLSSYNKDDDIAADRISTLTGSSQHSSFCDDLLNHFERRLSDLGPRSKYPYLQHLERSATNGAFDNMEKNVKYEGIGVGGRTVQVPLVRTKGIRAQDNLWWRYGGGYFDRDVPMGGQKRDGENGQANRMGRKRNGAHGGMFESENRNYDTLEPL